MEGLFMARPKKETEQKVKNLIMLRLTDTQYEIVCEYARLMGLPPAVYVRKVVTEGRHPIQCNIVRNDEKIDKLIAQLSCVGNNLNQIMHKRSRSPICSKWHIPMPLCRDTVTVL